MVIKKSLYQISPQTGIPRPTLAYRADKLFGRHEGEFSQEEAQQLVAFGEENLEILYKSQSGENSPTIPPTIQNNGISAIPFTPTASNSLAIPTSARLSASIQVVPLDILKQIDRYVEWRIPMRGKCPNHEQLLRDVIMRGLGKAKAYVEEAQKWLREQAKEFDKWLEEQM